MKTLSRRDCMGWAAAGVAVSLEAAAGAPKRIIKHGRGHVHHHPHYEQAGVAPDCLNAIAQSKGLAFGSALGVGIKAAKASVPAGHKIRLAPFDDPRLRALFVEQCGILVPENKLKWPAPRHSPGKYDFGHADILMAFADRYRLAVRGHTLLWNRAVAAPNWINAFDFGPSPAAKAENMLRDHISTVCRRFGDRVFSYDVVNETIDPATGELESTAFTKALGPDVIDICFRAARQAAPHAELVYNDYMDWSAKSATHRAGVLALLARLKTNNVPIDALGIQSHIRPDGLDAGPLGDADEAEWRKFLDTVTGMGLKLVITEFDVDDRNVIGTAAERDRIVADYAKAYLDIVLSYPQLRYVMAWGLVDKYSWLQSRAPRADGSPARPCPYDDAFKPKPLRQAMAQALTAAPARAPVLFNQAVEVP